MSLYHDQYGYQSHRRKVMKFICRLPFAENFISANLQDSGENLIEFSSFLGDKKLKIKTQGLKTLDEKDFEDFFKESLTLPEAENQENFPNHENYLLELEKAIETIRENNLAKLVISRPIKKEISNLNLEASFKNICDKYKNTLCYLFISGDEIWMGATPEILGKFNKKSRNFFTMSLAGTLPLNEDWSDKEIEEQKPVSEYILVKLKRFSNEVNVSETYTHTSGNIKHLRTDFSAEIKPENLENLIKDLHPTPAICGIPKNLCKQKIMEIENYNREFYAGYIKIETEEDIYYFVNLRCAKIFKNSVIAFAGGGITIKSNPEKEWQETELKSQAILNHLIYN